MADAELTERVAARRAVVRLLGAQAAPRAKRRRGESERRADAGRRDLRPLLEDAEVLEVDEEAHRGGCEWCCAWIASGAGRPEDVVGALDLPLEPGPAVADPPPLR